MLIKEFYSIFSIPLTHLINCSLENVVFSEMLKTDLLILKNVVKLFTRKVMRIFMDILELRITLVSTISKTFKKIVLNRLTEFLSTNDILYQNQFAFEKGKNTNTQFLKLLLQYMHTRAKSITDIDKNTIASGFSSISVKPLTQ